MKILFILKERLYAKNTNSYGLINSSRHVASYLEKIGHDCKVVQVVDGNNIDAEVFKYKPNMVIIEALWVSAPKLKELMEIPRYSNITWVIRIHSDIGFLSAETLALTYVNDYIDLRKEKLYISTNNFEFNKNLSKVLNYEFAYLPNIIKIKHHHSCKKIIQKNHIDVGCFGSLRIMKNQCYQAMCAIEMADRLKKKLKFHITVDVGMSEGNNRYPVLKNLEEMFSNSKHDLVKHDWMPNHELQDLIASLDIGMQVSYTESFNIVSADFVNNRVPIVVSEAIAWLPSILKTSTTEYEKTVRKLIKIYKRRNSRSLIWWMQYRLFEYNTDAEAEWKKFLYFISKPSESALTLADLPYTYREDLIF